MWDDVCVESGFVSILVIRPTIVQSFAPNGDLIGSNDRKRIFLDQTGIEILLDSVPNFDRSERELLR